MKWYEHKIWILVGIVAALITIFYFIIGKNIPDLLHSFILGKKISQTNNQINNQPNNQSNTNRYFFSTLSYIDDYKLYIHDDNKDRFLLSTMDLTGPFINSNHTKYAFLIIDINVPSTNVDETYIYQLHFYNKHGYDHTFYKLPILYKIGFKIDTISWVDNSTIRIFIPFDYYNKYCKSEFKEINKSGTYDLILDNLNIVTNVKRYQIKY